MKKYKYPKTPHLPWSEGIKNDDRIIENINTLENNNVTVTEKLDGENTTIYSNAIHARSTDSLHHPSRSWVKSLQSKIGYKIPKNFRICGENMYAKHSIHYKFLTTYFYVFAVYEDNMCLSWEDTCVFCQDLDLQTVPVLYKGIWNLSQIKKLYTGKSFFSKNSHFDIQEGYVVRISNSFYLKDHPLSIAKFVRKDHVQTSNHWITEQVVVNQTI